MSESFKGVPEPIIDRFNEGYNKGYQAGLKRGAELCDEMMTGADVPDARMAAGIDIGLQNLRTAIKREMLNPRSEDAPSSFGSPDS